MGESNTVVSAYTLYRHLQQYCSHPSNYVLAKGGLYAVYQASHDIITDPNDRIERSGEYCFTFVNPSVFVCLSVCTNNYDKVKT